MRTMFTSSADERAPGLRLGRTLDPLDQRDGGLAETSITRVELANVSPVGPLLETSARTSSLAALGRTAAPMITPPPPPDLAAFVPFLVAAGLLLAAHLVKA